MFKTRTKTSLTSTNSQTSSEGDFSGFELRPTDLGTYLNVFITIDPVLRPMDSPALSIESQESSEILKHSAAFVQQCKQKFPNRSVKATVIDIKGESVFITRFVLAAAAAATYFPACLWRAPRSKISLRTLHCSL